MAAVSRSPSRVVAGEPSIDTCQRPSASDQVKVKRAAGKRTVTSSSGVPPEGAGPSRRPVVAAPSPGGPSRTRSGRRYRLCGAARAGSRVKAPASDSGSTGVSGASSISGSSLLWAPEKASSGSSNWRSSSRSDSRALRTGPSDSGSRVAYTAISRLSPPSTCST
ncbi:hypothetical protein GCM10010285_58720 [Streptomyces pseudogriseolus]|uniref:Uncharacterized protein n=1 Tax=Streptomyces pseudogriseolus TaxID=36817 RepID=A0ABQ2TIF5_STREZ|nr:hypothetical protein GCM10010285_58720 [Streptomyces rubiginosus]